LFSYLDVACARNRDDMRSLSKKPGKRSLPRGPTMPLPNLFNLFDYPEHVREVLLRVPWNDTTEVALLKVIRASLSGKTSVSLGVRLLFK
jgi:hypothetical protein